MLRSDPKKLLQEIMARFVDREVIPRAREIDESEELPLDLFKQLAKMGILGIRYPKKVGGSGGNTTLYCVAMQELARGLLSLAATTAMQCLMATNGLYLYGTKKMHEEFLRPALNGEKIGAFQLTEPEAGSDLSNVQTRARKTKDGYVINGMKTWSTNG
ncbi:MAG: acyl-CoA dehydrogenase, partial [Xanthomonadaceae bacterium]|nr:acyl-CoA dehydrogenase [Xanthomonadaceae bacterium]